MIIAAKTMIKPVRGTRVRGFDLHPHPNPQVESIVGDIRNLSDVRLACDGVEGVIHLASVSG